MDNTALIAMSGGVDSSAAALLMQKAGFDCKGAMMRLSGRESFGDAEKICKRLGIPFYDFDFSEEFKKRVMTPFVNSYEMGETPNPCIECNRFLKFGELFRKAEELGCDYLVTGHYARIEYDEKRGRFLLKKAVNETKDQSYVLYFLSQEQLSHIRFPLGEYADKSEIREIAERNGLANAKKGDSQDICFVPDGDYAVFIERFGGKSYPEGDFLDIFGNVLGKHRGLIHYTIGQRKGLGIAYSEPLYVCGKSVPNNAVILGTQRELYRCELTARDFNWISLEAPPEKPISVGVRTRYHAKEARAEVTANADGTVTVRFEQPHRAIAAGQAIVLYDGDIVVGGGRIV